MKVKKYKSEAEALKRAEEIRKKNPKIIDDIMSDEGLQSIFKTIYCNLYDEDFKDVDILESMFVIIPALELLELFEIIKINE